MTSGLPARVLSWYGDDFTGSTDVLEALAPHMPAVLFLRRPSDEFLAQFAAYAAFGLAGVSRSQSPAWMDAHLGEDLAWLKALGAAVCHYKVCSTFDSSPNLGSIGRATEIGKQVFGSSCVPIVVGAPPLGRYTFFGNLFARAGTSIHRIDRHPTMMRHPVTPMKEADLRLHLREQTSLTIALMDALELESAGADERYLSLMAASEAVLIDVMNRTTMASAGRLLWSVNRQPFVVGSSGVEYSLLAFLGLKTPALASASRVDRIAVLSGSCSAVTEEQIRWAGQNGFELIRLDVAGLIDGRASAADDAVHAGVAALRRGQSALLHTAASAADRIECSPAARQRLGEQAGRVLHRVIDESGVSRVVIAGGDTSSHAGQQLEIDALTFVAPVAPGAPLCRAWSLRFSRRQDLEILFKGGQCGRANFFETVRSGESQRN